MKKIGIIILVILTISLALMAPACSQKEIKIELVSPNGGEQWETNETHKITWSYTGFEANAPVQIGLRDGRYDPNIGQGEMTIANTTNKGFYVWTIPSTIESRPLEAGSFFKIVLYIDDGGEGKYDLSDNSFQITQSSQSSPQITIISDPPASDGKVTISVGDTITITGKPLNLSEITSKAFFFGPVFDGSLSNDKGDWELTGPAKKEGVSNFYIEAYKDGETYKSNVIEVTVKK